MLRGVSWHERFRTDEPEILDLEGLSERGLRILHGLDRFNRRIGWTRFHVRAVKRWWAALGHPEPFRIVDVGCGDGGFLVTLADTAAAEQLPWELHGVDRSRDYAAHAQARLGDRAQIHVADATALPDEASWDLATSCLVMHHLPPEVRHGMVAELARTCRAAYLFDLQITAHGLFGTGITPWVLGMTGDLAHDGHVSIRRAATRPQFEELVAPLPGRVRTVLPTAQCTWPS